MIVFAFFLGCAGGTPPGGASADGPGSTSDAGDPGDAGGGGGGPPPGDAASQVVTVVVHDFSPTGGPYPGAMVSFADPAGVAIALATTDANGRAAAVMPTGGSVAIGIPRTGSTLLWAAVGVKPGDQLNLGLPVPPAAHGTVNVTLPAAVANATSYSISTGCDQVTATAGQAAAVPLDRRCVDASGKYGLLAFATGASGTLATTVMLGLTAPNPNATANVTLGAFQAAFDSATVTAVNPPANTATLQVMMNMQGSGGIFRDIDAGQSLTTPQVTFTPVWKGPWSVYATSLATATADRTRGSLLLRGFAALPSGTIDMTADMLPYLEGVAVTASPTGGLPTFQWQPYARPLVGMVAQTAWTVGTTGYNYDVAFLPGATQTSLAPLQVPAAMAALVPPAGTKLTLVQIQGFAGSAFAGADDFRSRIGEVFFQQPLIQPAGKTLLRVVNGQTL